MLPGLLTETLCSLKSGVDRFSFSVTWEFTPRASAVAWTVDAAGVPTCEWESVVGATRYFKSIIHSRAALTYAAAQALLDAPPPAVESTVGKVAPPEASPVSAGIKLLASIARSLRNDRKAAGALSLASPEVRFLLDSETHEPLDVSAYEQKETNSLVEEFM